MAQETLLHILPAVPPMIDGLADYCYKLWEHWPAPRPRWHCLAREVPPGAGAAWPEATIESFAPSKAGLLAALEASRADCVVLHYVGYAYQKRGVPLWLPGALRAWKTRGGGRVCAMFHELYAVGTPRQSAFWLQPLAESIVAQLAQLADVWVCSNEESAARLVHRIGADIGRGRFIPVGSGIAPVAPVNFERAWPLSRGEKLRIAIFGLPATREGALREHRHLLRLLCEVGLVEQISLIGKSGAAPAPQLCELQAHIAPDNKAIWREFSDLAPAQLSEVLMGHHLSLSRNYAQLLTKSSSYAAACVHGLPTICLPAKSEGLPPSGLGHISQLPYLANSGENSAAIVEVLRDANAVNSWRQQTKSAALGCLSWNEILRQWSQSVGF